MKELEIPTVTYRSKGKREHGPNVGRGRARRGVPLTRKCNQCLLANFDSGGLKIALDVNPDGGSSTFTHFTDKESKGSSDMKHACTRGPRKIEQVEFYKQN